MTPDLSRRIGRAFTTGAATIAERDQLQKVATPREVRSVEDLPVASQQLLLDLESRGRR